MNSAQNPSEALASILAILSQTTQKPSDESRVHSQSIPALESRQELEPVFAEGDILDTSQWIGASTTVWYEPRNWQLLPPDSRTSGVAKSDPIVGTSLSPPAKRHRSDILELENQTQADGRPSSFTSYPQALKHVLHLIQYGSFTEAIKRIKDKQHVFESNLYEERCRLTRKWESKRKMDQILQSLNSQSLGNQVNNHYAFY